MTGNAAIDFGVPCHLEQPRGRDVRHFIPRLRRQHRRDQDLKRILAAVFADLFDRRLLHAANGAAEAREDGGDRAGRCHHRQA
jgi:predicted secreted Zn-dependent protease